MPVNSSVSRFHLDNDTVLRARGLAAVSADTASTALPLDVLSSYWDNGELANSLQFAVIVEIESLSLGGGTLDIQVQVDDAVGFPSPVIVQNRAAAATGRLVFVLTREQINAADINATHIRVFADLTGGTSPQFAFSAFLSPLVGH